jgi:hypothetical protein
MRCPGVRIPCSRMRWSFGRKRSDGATPAYICGDRCRFLPDTAGRDDRFQSGRRRATALPLQGISMCLESPPSANGCSLCRTSPAGPLGQQVRADPGLEQRAFARPGGGVEHGQAPALETLEQHRPRWRGPCGCRRERVPGPSFASGKVDPVGPFCSICRAGASRFLRCSARDRVSRAGWHACVRPEGARHGLAGAWKSAHRRLCPRPRLGVGWHACEASWGRSANRPNFGQTP